MALSSDQFTALPQQAIDAGIAYATDPWLALALGLSRLLEQRVSRVPAGGT